METSDITIFRKFEKYIKKEEKLERILDNWSEKETWLFVSPHDDDVVIGGGLILIAALKEKVEVYLLIVSDGRMGYCSLEDREKIVEIRKEETYNAYTFLGMKRENIIWGNFPDCNLTSFVGRKKSSSSDVGVIEGYTGLQNCFTYWLRKIKPTRVFVPTGEDLHPDHKITYQELMISLYHATGDIWPELGPPLKRFPQVYELAVYCDFPSPPEIKLETTQEIFEKKLKAIGMYRSQKQIALTVEGIRKSGPVEYIKLVSFNLYSPERYKNLFLK